MSSNSFESFSEKRKKPKDEEQKRLSAKKDPKANKKKEKKASVVDELPKEKRDKKTVAAIAAGIIVLAVIGVLAWFLVFAPQNNLSFNEKETEEIEQQSSQSVDSSQSTDIEFTTETIKIFPRPYQEWETFNEIDLEDPTLPLRKNANIDAFRTPTSLPKAAAGYTSDPDLMITDDGLNPMFTTITEEDYMEQLARIVEIFLNPVFGGWEILQYGNNSGEVLVSDMIGYPFTETWLEEHSNEDAREVFPIYADVNSDDYGMAESIRESGPRWIGDLTSGSLEMTFNDETLQYDGVFTGNVKFLSFGKGDKEILEANGVLTLDLVVDESGKVLVNGSSLTVTPS